MINHQIESTNELIKKNDVEQKAMAEKIQKAKQFYYDMAQKLQANQWSCVDIHNSEYKSINQSINQLKRALSHISQFVLWRLLWYVQVGHSILFAGT